MATEKQQAFILVMKFTWLLCRSGAATSVTPCEVTVTQPRSLEAYTASQNVRIWCSFSTKECPGASPTILWFRYLANTHENLCVPDCAQGKKFNVTHVVSDKKTFLYIYNVSVEDSAIYYCGVAFADSAARHSKQTGEGTALTITDRDKGAYVMAVILVLLFLYVVAGLTTFTVYSKPRTKKTGGGGHSRGIKGSKQAISQAIAQELGKKKQKLKRCPKRSLGKETVDRNK
ncbi:immunoglobulin superfamily member 6 [Sphaerodactylus townsendi]|uniref:immunoglobulin superfamily member 6 n=1 Tax=Sphaerodactylus townsendi TaxID=933632 RepID=UPI002026B83F|nr:immunoglobulin superfamily member 6 [Sphaerodactylus townsendi]